MFDKFKRLEYLLQYHKNLSIQYSGYLISTKSNNGYLVDQLSSVEQEIEETLNIEIETEDHKE